MATKKEKTNYSTSFDFKTALLEKAIQVTPMPNDVVYDGSGTDEHLIIADTSDGSYRTINFVNGVGSFDFVESTDPALVKAWTKRELENFIGIYPGVQSSETEINAGPPITYTHRIGYNGQVYSATNSNLPNAMAKAMIKILNL